jgi:hypothetical protein
MRFLCFVACLIGFRRILLLVLILMAIAIAQHHKRCDTAVSPPTRPTSAAQSKQHPRPYPRGGVTCPGIPRVQR